MFDRIPLNLCLNRSIFNALVGNVAPADYDNVHQFKHVDSDIANSLKFILENELGDDQGESMLGFYFTSTNENNMTEVDLKPGGSQIPVTDSNKQEFARLKCHYHAYKACAH